MLVTQAYQGQHLWVRQIFILKKKFFSGLKSGMPRVPSITTLIVDIFILFYFRY